MAVEIVRGLIDGRSRPFLVAASDGHQYIVKSPSSPTQARGLIAEYLAARIGLQIGIPVAPRCVLVDLPTDLPTTGLSDRVRENPR